MKRKKSFLIIFLFYLFTSLIQNGNSKNSKTGSSRKSSGRISRNSSMSREKPNYEHAGYKTDKIVAEEYVQKLIGTNRYFLPEAIDADIFCYEDINEGKLMKEENPKMSKEETVGEVL